MKYLLEKKDMETKTEDVVHPMDAFLSGIGATLKTLDPYNLNLAKSRIFNIAHEIEMNQILYKQTDTFYNNAPTSSSAGNPYIGTQLV
ncbi:transcription factor Adf-1-like [Aphis craccivora]|uniref:Transcription factor Adf-1-like n=1 Tax=Aphis craccivora TaxID=307492 RepID=A0A6G0W0R5_APHCR|nr:transcription factor Adf-1-like [Aphis craccivora]